MGKEWACAFCPLGSQAGSLPANHLLTIAHHDCIEDFEQPSGEYYAQVLGNCCSGGWLFAYRYADRHGEY